MSSGMSCEKYEAAEKQANKSNEEAEQKTYCEKSTQTEFPTQTECADGIFFLPITVRVGVHSNHQGLQSIDEFCIEACSKLKELLPGYCPPASLKKIASEENDSEDDGLCD